MKVVQINSVCEYGSTGKICVELSKVLIKNDIENYILYSYGKSTYELAQSFSSKLYIKLNALKSRILGNYGFNSMLATYNLIKKLNAISPDIVHIHNIHGHDVNLKKLFKYLSKKEINIVLTFHDCWFFTGYCPYFDFADCAKWQYGCCKCKQYRKFSWFLDRSKKLYNSKKVALTSVKNMILVTPSNWLANLTRQSFLKGLPVEVINNGIDLNLFSCTKNNIREKYNLGEKKIVLAISMGFSEQKGSKYILELANLLDESFQIIIIGLNDEQLKKIPKNVLGLKKTANQTELAQFYSEADVFVNPTLEDNFPTVNIEALACGTPVVTFNTGGSVECVDENTGRIVPQRDTEALKNAIIEICSHDRDVLRKECRKKAEIFYNAKKQYEKYIDLYNKLLS